MFALRAAPEQARGRPARTAQHPAWSGDSARSAAGSPGARCPLFQRLRPGRHCPRPGGRRSLCPPRRSCGDSECARRAQGPCRGRDCKEASPSRGGKLAWRGMWVTPTVLCEETCEEAGVEDRTQAAEQGQGTEMRVEPGRTSARSVPLRTPPILVQACTHRHPPPPHTHTLQARPLALQGFTEEEGGCVCCLPLLRTCTQLCGWSRRGTLVDHVN